MVVPAVTAGVARTGKAVAGDVAKTAKSGGKKASRPGRTAARNNPVAQNRRTRQLDKLQVEQRSTTPVAKSTISETQQTPLQKIFKQRKAKKEKEGSRLGRELRRARAATIASAQTIAHLPFYGVQVCFAAMYVVSKFVLEDSVADLILPVSSLLYIAQAVIITIGVLSMFQAWFVFTAARVRIFSNASFIAFGVLTLAYVFPYFGFLPLMIIWVWLVVIFQ